VVEPDAAGAGLVAEAGTQFDAIRFFLRRGRTAAGFWAAGVCAWGGGAGFVVVDESCAGLPESCAGLAAEADCSVDRPEAATVDRIDGQKKLTKRIKARVIPGPKLLKYRVSDVTPLPAECCGYSDREGSESVYAR
jgi:hypothetical protein